MQTKKMNLADIKGKLSREEMRNVLAGRNDGSTCSVGLQCWHWYRATWGYCYPSGDVCYCVKSGAAVHAPECSGYWA